MIVAATFQQWAEGCAAVVGLSLGLVAVAIVIAGGELNRRAWTNKGAPPTQRRARKETTYEL